jgi:hypothetical protein
MGRWDSMVPVGIAGRSRRAYDFVSRLRFGNRSGGTGRTIYTVSTVEKMHKSLIALSASDSAGGDRRRYLG